MLFKVSFLFSITFLTSLLASIPFGPINLHVIHTTIERNRRAGLIFAAGAAIIELLQSSIALRISPEFLVPFLDHPLTILSTALFFVVLGIMFLLEKPETKMPEGTWTTWQFKPFVKGIFISAMNLPTIAFWIGMIAYFRAAKWFDFLESDSLIFNLTFITAAALGKLITLSTYALLASWFYPQLGKLRRFLPRFIGILFLMLGLFQIFRIFLFDLASQIG